MSESQHLHVIVTGVKDELPDVKTFSIVAENGKLLRYLPGQFITLSHKHNNKEERRSYSFCTSPGIDSHTAFAVKRIDNGIVSRLLFDRIKEGDVLLATGVAGMFTLPENINAYKQVVFFAGGIGISPELSLIKALLHSNPSIYVTLIYSNRSQKETLFREELNALQRQFPARFEIVHRLSNHVQLSNARISKEIVPGLLHAYVIEDYSKVLFYICGPFAYMRMVIYALEEMQVPAENIRKENFNPAITQYRSIPPDKDSHRVILHNGEDDFAFEMAYPDTILQAAEKQGIELPFSCRSGVCSSCVARCIKGKVWHSNNEVLTDMELSNGLILTCTAYPIEGDIEVQY